MVVFTKLDRLVHEEMKKEDAEYDENRSRTMKDLMSLLESTNCVDYRRFGSGTSKTAVGNSDIDIMVMTQLDKETQLERLEKKFKT